MITKRQWRNFVRDIARFRRFNATYRGYKIKSVEPDYNSFTTIEKLPEYGDNQKFVIYNWEGYVDWHKRNGWARDPKGKLRYLYEQVNINTNLYEMTRKNR